MRAGIGRGVVAVARTASACTSFGDTPATTNAVDAGVVTPPTDGTDASTDAGVTFFDGFERSVADVRGAWGTLTDNHGTAELVTENPHGGTDAFHSQLPALTSSDNGKELLITLPLAGSTRVSASFWVRAATGTRKSKIMELNFSRAGTTSSALVISDKSGDVSRARMEAPSPG